MFQRNQIKFFTIAVCVGLAHCGKHEMTVAQPAPTTTSQPAVDPTQKLQTKPAPVLPAAKQTPNPTPTPQPIVEDKSVIKNLSPQDLANTTPNYDLTKNAYVTPAKNLVPASAAISTAIKNTTAPAAAASGFFIGNETIGNLFSDYGNLNIDSNFNSDDMKKILSSPTLTSDQRDQVLKQVFKIIETSDSRVSDKISLHDRIQKVFDLYNQSAAALETDPQYINNNRFAQLLKDRAIAEDANFILVPADIQNKIAPMIYAIGLVGKTNQVDIRQHLQLKPAGLMAYINQSIDPLKYDPALMNSGKNSLKDLTSEVDRRVDAVMEYFKNRAIAYIQLQNNDY